MHSQRVWKPDGCYRIHASDSSLQLQKHYHTEALCPFLTHPCLKLAGLLFRLPIMPLSVQITSVFMTRQRRFSPPIPHFSTRSYKLWLHVLVESDLVVKRSNQYFRAALTIFFCQSSIVYVTTW